MKFSSQNKEDRGEAVFPRLLRCVPITCSARAMNRWHFPRHKSGFFAPRYFHLNVPLVFSVTLTSSPLPPTGRSHALKQVVHSSGFAGNSPKLSKSVRAEAGQSSAPGPGSCTRGPCASAQRPRQPNTQPRRAHGRRRPADPAPRRRGSAR